MGRVSLKHLLVCFFPISRPKKLSEKHWKRFALLDIHKEIQDLPEFLQVSWLLSPHDKLAVPGKARGGCGHPYCKGSFPLTLQMSASRYRCSSSALPHQCHQVPLSNPVSFNRHQFPLASSSFFFLPSMTPFHQTPNTSPQPAELKPPAAYWCSLSLFTLVVHQHNNN